MKKALIKVTCTVRVDLNNDKTALELISDHHDKVVSLVTDDLKNRESLVQAMNENRININLATVDAEASGFYEDDDDSIGELEMEPIV